MKARKPRKFHTGAIRDRDAGKLDFDACFSPAAMESFARYMAAHRKLKNKTTRSDDNWQKGIPLESYRKSAWRHFFAFWKLVRLGGSADQIERAINGAIFNLQGYQHEHLKLRGRK